MNQISYSYGSEYDILFLSKGVEAFDVLPAGCVVAEFSLFTVTVRFHENLIESLVLLCFVIR